MCIDSTEDSCGPINDAIFDVNAAASSAVASSVVADVDAAKPLVIRLSVDGTAADLTFTVITFDEEDEEVDDEEEFTCCEYVLAFILSYLVMRITGNSRPPGSKLSFPATMASLRYAL